MPPSSLRDREGTSPVRSSGALGESSGLFLLFTHPIGHLDLISRQGWVGATTYPPTTIGVTPEPPNGESRGSVGNNGWAPRRRLREGARTPARLLGTADRGPRNNVDRISGSYDTPSTGTPARDVGAMRDPVQLWGQVVRTIDRAESTLVLAEILVRKEGREFVSRLERGDAGICIEILGRVGHHSPFLLPPAT